VPGRDRVAVEGLEQFRRALRTLDGSLGKVLRLALNEGSALIIDRARPLIPARTGKARRSLKAASSQNTVRVRVGGRAAPYYPWLDYGGNVGRNDSAHRPFISDGRYLYPTLGKYRAEFERILNDALVDVARQAGVDVD
jgi:hypothetical protein